MKIGKRASALIHYLEDFLVEMDRRGYDMTELYVLPEQLEMLAGAADRGSSRVVRDGEALMLNGVRLCSLPS